MLIAASLSLFALLQCFSHNVGLAITGAYTRSWGENLQLRINGLVFSVFFVILK